MEGNAENLEHIPDNTMDAYTIAFGIRNCTHVDRVLKEAYRAFVVVSDLNLGMLDLFAHTPKQSVWD